MTDFTTTVSNNLEEISMIAGDEQIFYYEVVNKYGNPLNLEGAECSVQIFRYGDPTYLFADISGSVILSGSSVNYFSIAFSGSDLAGLFQQQVNIIDVHGKRHVPSQGKIIIFPGTTSSG